MSEYRQRIERLREIYLRFEAEKFNSLSRDYCLLNASPSLSTAQPTKKEKQYYYHRGFIDGVKFFQSLIQNYPKRMASFTAKEGGKS